MPRNLALRIVVIAYIALAVVLAVWAWYLNVTLPQQEHLLPNVLLSSLTLPSSLTMVAVYTRWPDLLNGSAQLGYLAFCAVFQGCLLFLLLSKRKA